jgi:predicted nucleic acid-binding protein
MVEQASSSAEFLLDTSPLIYLAKIDALDVLERRGRAWITPTVRTEAIVPATAFRFPEIVAIEAAIDRGAVGSTALTTGEQARVAWLVEQVPGLGHGECEAISVAIERAWPVALTGRRAVRVAGALGAQVIDVFDLVISGTRDTGPARKRVRVLAGLMNLRLEALMAMLERLEPDGRSR